MADFLQILGTVPKWGSGGLVFAIAYIAFKFYEKWRDSKTQLVQIDATGAQTRATHDVAVFDRTIQAQEDIINGLRAENDGLRDDLNACRDARQAEREQHFKDLRDLDHKNRQLQTVADGFEWMKTRPDILRRMADELEQKNAQG